SRQNDRKRTSTNETIPGGSMRARETAPPTMPCMTLGIFYEWPNPEVGDWQRLFEEGIEQIQYAEELGFDFVLIAEHHFSNYGMSPAPLLQAMAIAERTKRIRVGTAVLVLPVWQPLRLAEEIAVLDNLTGGRF